MSVPTPAARSDRVPVAVAAILVSVLALSAGDAVIKLTSARFPIWQIYVLRSAAIVPILLVLLRWRERATSLIPKRPPWVLLRSTLLVTMWIAYYTALPEIDLSLAAAAYYTAPLMITWLSARLADERVGSGRAGRGGAGLRRRPRHASPGLGTAQRVRGRYRSSPRSSTRSQ